MSNAEVDSSFDNPFPLWESLPMDRTSHPNRAGRLCPGKPCEYKLGSSDWQPGIVDRISGSGIRRKRYWVRTAHMGTVPLESHEVRTVEPEPAPVAVKPFVPHVVLEYTGIGRKSSWFSRPEYIGVPLYRVIRVENTVNPRVRDILRESEVGRLVTDGYGVTIQ